MNELLNHDFSDSNEAAMIFRLTLFTLFLAFPVSSLLSQQPTEFTHTIAAAKQGKFYGWPANNGAWHWGNEILVGMTEGDFKIKPGHNITGKEKSLLSRSLDGGKSWELFDPNGFLDDDNHRFLAHDMTALKDPIDFSTPGLALRFIGEGYHGNEVPQGGFFYSIDRGNSWHGPYSFKGLTDHPEMKDHLFSPRTDYLVQDKNCCLIFLSARPASGGEKRMACIDTNDGGRSFQFVSWVAPAMKKSRTVMSQTVPLSENELLLSCRKINKGEKICGEIITYHSTDGGKSWKELSTVCQTTVSSNPPGLVKLKDGRLCCVYGDRSVAKILGRYSSDQGKTWGDQFVVRDDYVHVKNDNNDNPDLGYVRLVERPDGKLVAMYYWSTKSTPHNHIAVSIWKP